MCLFVACNNNGTSATTDPPIQTTAQTAQTTAATSDAKTSNAASTTAGGGSATTAPPAATLSKEKLAYYQKAFPNLARVVPKTIPKELIRVEDQSNTAYVEAFDADGNLLGYMRDFEGPVTFKEACACNPLKLTLAYTPGLKFKTIISPAPLQKWGHEPMTDAEFARLLEIVAEPAPELMQTPTIEAVVDGTSGATKQAYKDLVVARAALSTRRIAALVGETRQALAGAPLSDAQRELNTIMLTAAGNPAKLTQGLAAYLTRTSGFWVR
ncbi:MAG: hypothetical protein AAFX99_34235, partial [Myxococcota bacterium]